MEIRPSSNAALALQASRLEQVREAVAEVQATRRPTSTDVIELSVAAQQLARTPTA